MAENHRALARRQRLHLVQQAVDLWRQRLPLQRLAPITVVDERLFVLTATEEAAILTAPLQAADSIGPMARRRSPLET